MSGPARPPDRALIHHFTHIGNVGSILAAGRLLSDTDSVAAGVAADVGDPDVKALRRCRRVDCGPGGVVADYVPFYFAPRSPMMFRIACDHRDRVPGRYADGEDPLVYMVSSVEGVRDAGLSWVASDGNCAHSLSRFTSRVDELPSLVDWALMREARWYNTRDDPDRLRRRMAEFLVHRAFPIELVLGYVVRTDARRRQLDELLRSAGRGGAYVDVRPSWYYGYAPRG